MSNAGLSPSPVATALSALSKNYPVPQADTWRPQPVLKTGNSLNNNQGDLKIDYVMSDKDRLFGRWSQMHLSQPSLRAAYSATPAPARVAISP